MNNGQYNVLFQIDVSCHKLSINRKSHKSINLTCYDLKIIVTCFACYDAIDLFQCLNIPSSYSYHSLALSTISLPPVTKKKRTRRK